MNTRKAGLIFILLSLLTLILFSISASADIGCCASPGDCYFEPVYTGQCLNVRYIFNNDTLCEEIPECPQFDPNQLPSCSDDKCQEILTTDCNCVGTYFNSSSDDYCGYRQGITYVGSDQVACRNTIGASRKIVFTIRDENDSSVIQGAIISLEGDTQSTDALGQAIFYINISSAQYTVSPPNSNYLGTSGFAQIPNILPVENTVNVDLERVEVPPICSPEDSTRPAYTSGGCDYIQVCSGGTWGAAIKEDLDCGQKTFCDDTTLDYGLGEECRPDQNPDCDAIGYVGYECIQCKCQLEIESVTCGNGVIEGTEPCDYIVSGESISYVFREGINPIDKECTKAPTGNCILIQKSTCENGEVTGSEECDWINTTAGLDFNELDSDCEESLCIPRGEQGECTCRQDFSCGDGYKQGLEQCDDGQDGTVPSGTDFGTFPNVCPTGSTYSDCDQFCVCRPPLCPTSTDTLEITNLDFNLSKPIELQITLENLACQGFTLTELYFNLIRNNEIGEVISNDKFLVNLSVLTTLNPSGTIIFNFDKTGDTTYFDSRIGSVNIESGTTNIRFLATYESLSLTTKNITSNTLPISLGEYLCYLYGATDFCYNNIAYNCSVDRELSLEANCTSQNKSCTYNNNQAVCAEVVTGDACRSNCSGLFGMFSYFDNILTAVSGNNHCNDLITRDNPALISSCYIDYDASIVDLYKKCSGISNCYDYKSKGTCEKDACSLTSTDVAGSLCEWEPIQGKLGIGVCRPNQAELQDCDVCNQRTDNDEIRNKMFEVCSKTTCPAYGSNCFYSNADNLCIEQNNMGCEDYDSQEECIGLSLTNASFDYTADTSGVVLSGDNSLDTNSNDTFGFNICTWVGSLSSGSCIKDYDNDSNSDCIYSSEDFDICTKDINPPSTNVQYKSLMSGLPLNVDFISVDDKDEESDITTYYCIEQENTYCYPDQVAGAEITENFNEGTDGDYTLRVYSMDKGMNRERVQEIGITLDNTPPTIDTYEISYDYYTTFNIYEEKPEWKTNLTVKIQILDGLPPNQDVSFANCTARLFKDNTEPVYDSTISIKGSWVNQTTQKYPGLLDGEYTYNISCTDIAGNTNQTSFIFRVEANLNINTLLPNVTLDSSPAELSFKTAFPSVCVLTTNSSRTYKDAFIPPAYTQTLSDSMDIGVRDLILRDEHYTSFANFIAKFPQPSTSYVSEKYYARCNTTADATIKGVMIGNDGDFIQYAVDNDPPIIVMAKNEQETYTQTQLSTEWFQDYEYLFFSYDTPLVNTAASGLKRWEGGVDTLDLDSTIYSDSTTSCKNRESINIAKGTPSKTACIRGNINTTGIHQITLTSTDLFGNQNQTIFTVNIDNDQYEFDLVLYDLDNNSEVVTSGLIKPHTYNVELIPTKDFDNMLILDSNYTMTITGFTLHTSLGPLPITLGFDSATNTFKGFINIRTQLSGFEDENPSFSINSFDSHGITSNTINNFDSFFIDTLPADKPKLDPILSTNQNELGLIRYFEDWQNNPYPFVEYNGVFYTNQNSLFITGEEYDTNSTVLFSVNDRFAYNYEYDVSSNAEDQTLNYAFVTKNSEAQGSDEITFTWTGINPTSSLTNTYLKIPSYERKQYGEYHKYYEVTGLAEPLVGEIRLTLNPALEVDIPASTPIEFHTAPHATEWFGLDIPLTDGGCDDLWITAVDTNENINYDDHIIRVCSNTQSPAVSDEFPNNGEAYTLINQEIGATINLFGDFNNRRIAGQDATYQIPYQELRPRLIINNQEYQPTIDSLRVFYDKNDGVQGIFEANLILYDLYNNLLNYTWSFELNDSLPPRPSVRFNLPSHALSQNDDDTIFVNGGPSGAGPNDIIIEAGDTNLFEILSSSLIRDSDPLSTDYLSTCQVASTYYNCTLNPLGDNEGEYTLRTQVMKNFSDNTLIRDYTKTVVYDKTAPSISIPSTLKVTVLDGDYFRIPINVSGEDYLVNDNLENLTSGIIISEDAPSTYQLAGVGQEIVYDDTNLGDGVDEYYYSWDVRPESINDRGEYTYSATIIDKANNSATLQGTISVDKEIPEFYYELIDYPVVPQIRNGVNILIHPDTYVFRLFSTKDFDTSKPIKVIINIGGTQIELLESEGQVTKNPTNNREINFTLSTTYHNLYNIGVEGMMSVVIDSTDIAGYSAQSSVDEVTGAEFFVDAKAPSMPTLTPIFNSFNNIQYTDKNGNKYPVYYQPDLSQYYTSTPNLLITGRTQGDVMNTLYRYELDTDTDAENFTQQIPEVVHDTVTAREIEGYAGETTLTILNYYTTIPMDVGSEYCLFIEGQPRDSFNNYNKGYKINSITSVGAGYYRVIFNLDEPLEEDILGNYNVKVTKDYCYLDEDFFAINVELIPGVNNIGVKNVDESGIFQLKEIGEVYLDSEAPVLREVYYPPQNGVINDKQPRIRFFICDLYSGIRDLVPDYITNPFSGSFKVELDGDPAIPIEIIEVNTTNINEHCYNLTFYPTVPFASKPYVVRITAYDYANNMMEDAWWTFKVDENSAQLSQFNVSDTTNKNPYSISLPVGPPGSHQVWFTRVSQPRFDMNFSDFQNVVIEGATLVDWQPGGTPNTLTTSLSDVNCQKNLGLGTNYYECELQNVALSADDFHELRINTRKTFNSQDYFQEYTSFLYYDPGLTVSNNNITFDRVTRSDEVDFQIEIINENYLNFDLLIAGETINLNKISNGPNTTSQRYFISLDDYSASLSPEGIPMFPSTLYDFDLVLSDYAGYTYTYNDTIRIDNVEPLLRITDLDSSPIQIIRGAFGDINASVRVADINISGWAYNDSSRGIVDIQRINVELYEGFDPPTSIGYVQTCPIIGPGVCDFNTAGSTIDISGCLCTNTGVFKLNLKELSSTVGADITNNIILKGVDDAGNSGSTSTYVLVDLKPPEIKRITVS